MLLKDKFPKSTGVFSIIKMNIPMIFMSVTMLIVATNARAIESKNATAALANTLSVDSSTETEFATMSLQTLLSKANNAKEMQKKINYAAAIGKRTPISRAEIKALFYELDNSDTRPITDPLIGSVAKSLEKVVDPAMAAEFAGKIKHGAVYSRLIAIEMVGKFKYKAAVPDLINLVEGYSEAKTKDEGSAVRLRYGAVKMLGEIGDERAIPVMLKQLGKMGGEEEEALGKFGNKVLPQLLDLIRNSKDKEKKRSAGFVIAKLKDKEMIPQMWQILKNEKDDARYSALYMLQNTTDKMTSPTSDEVMAYVAANSRNNVHFQAAAISLAKKRKDIDYLVKAFQNPDIDHAWRREAIIMLGDLNAVSAVPYLEEALNTTDTEIRDFAAKSLKKITGKDYTEVRP